MSKLVIAVALAAAVASPALCQSSDPSVGSGNVALTVPSALDHSPAARRGFLFVSTSCAQCHAVDSTSASPLAMARPLRDMEIKYPVWDLQRPLSEGVHPRMPIVKLSAGQLGDIMAYLRTLER